MKTQKLWKYLSVILAVTLVSGIVYAVAIFGVVELTWEINQASAVLSPNSISLSMGKFIFDEQKTQSPSDALCDLIINSPSKIDLVLEEADSSGFVFLVITVELRQAGSVMYSATLEKMVLSATFGMVAVGNYDVFVGYDAVAGSVEGSGSISMQFIQGA